VIQLAYLFPLTGSGLGVAEWAIGLAVAAMPSLHLDESGGITASLISRSAELLTGVPLGLWAGAWIARGRSRAPQATIRAEPFHPAVDPADAP
jgi:hypothetical protein